MRDALVVGKGPAAIAAAAALAERGLHVAVLGPAGPVRWEARYGSWMDELAAAGCPDDVQALFSHPRVHTGRAEISLPRTYALVDNERLAARLVAKCDAAGVGWIDGEAEGAAHDPASTTVRLRGGGTERARVVIDASGHRPVLLRRASAPQGFQTALGWTLDVPHGFGSGEMVLMDWRDDHLPADGDRERYASFLYAFPLADGRLFVEETVLAARPAVPLEALEERLRHRLRSLGLDPGSPRHVERVWIPMGGALPPRQRVIGMGAAAGMVHPATGYSLARGLCAAGPMADAVAAGLGGEGGSPRRAAHLAWDSVWSADRRRRFALLRFGMEVLLAMPPAETRGFFDAFFAAPARDWAGYLNDRHTAKELFWMMTRLYERAPQDLRSRLRRGTLGPAGGSLAGGLLRTLAA